MCKKFICIKDRKAGHQFVFAKGKTYEICTFGTNNYEDEYGAVDDFGTVFHFGKQFLKEHFAEGN